MTQATPPSRWIELAQEQVSAMGLAPADMPTFRHQPTTATFLADQAAERLRAIDWIVLESIRRNEAETQAFLEHFAAWMFDRAPVRILGAGRARLAAALAGNRLSHGGARVYLQDSDTPMPHSLHGGGILAASASGKTASVLQALTSARAKNREVMVLGVASVNAGQFAAACNVFLPLPEIPAALVPALTALADLQEQAIGNLLDLLVVAAGRNLGFTDATWRLGHEDLGATGPYDYNSGTE